MTNENWGAETWRQPTEQDGDTVLFSEHGRIIGRTDYRSHWFKLVNPQYGPITLLVKHGAGEDRISLSYTCGDAVRDACAALDPDTRYRLLHSLLTLRHDSRRAARDETANEYRAAFADGRLKKRKLPSKGVTKVWIEAAA